MKAVQRGFTLVELMVTVAIVAVLALGALPLAELTVQRTREHELRSALRQIRGALDEYKRASDEGRIPREADASGYPPTLQLLVDGVVDAKDPAKRRIFFLRRLPPDPMQPEGGWGLRSYESTAEAPQPGKDVFDVYSRADGVGINGLPYRQW
jgi:general secretion pathway protein G